MTPAPPRRAAPGALRYDCFAIAAPGLEPLVARELVAFASLGVSAVREVPGGVEFRADARGLAESQLRLRTASRVVVRMAAFRATAFHELERAARQLEWGRFVAPGAPFRLRVTCRKSRLYHSDAVAERVAGAIVRAVPGATFVGGRERDDDVEEPGEAVGEGTGAARGAVPGDDPAVVPPQLFVVRLDHDRCTVSADASGVLLHRRGYRQALARAPMRETLAAALVLASGWDGRAPFVDPMCGSGTLAIEAAMIARRIAPGLGRAFAAERWPETPSALWSSCRSGAAGEMISGSGAALVASDRDEGAVAAARANAQRAGVADDIRFGCAPLSALDLPAGPGWLVTNPPYGVRVGERAALRSLYAALGRLVRERLAGWQVVIVAADAMLLGQTGLTWQPLVETSNGGIRVRFAARV